MSEWPRIKNAVLIFSLAGAIIIGVVLYFVAGVKC